MTEAVGFRVLGPPGAVVGGREVPLGGHKPRSLLAALLVKANTPMPVDELVDVLWPTRAPRSAAANLRTYVHVLRQRLPGERIGHSAAGYRLTVARGELDADVFTEHVTAATRAMERREPERALRELQAAEDHWHGEPLSGLPHHHGWHPLVARLTELRLAAHELRGEVRLALGEHAEAIPELRELVARHPLRERLWAQLVHALDTAGWYAEAVEAYHAAERVLRDELGTSPGPLLRERGARTLRTRPRDTATATGRVVCQLPLDLPDLTGRRRQADELVEVVRKRCAAGVPAVVVLSGPPGVGKSALAVHVAHRLRPEFPDGQLHVGLAGTTASQRTAHDVLAELLRALGVPDTAIPPTEDERSALLRSTVAGLSICLVVDDVRAAEQLRPLLPGTGACAVLVTARARLPDLTGAHHVDLDVLDHEAGSRLLARLVGADRVAVEPRQADRIVESCGRLPLALRVAGARLAHRRQWTLAMFADRIADERRRLDELRIGDLAVRACLELSYTRLPADAAAAFRGLGVLGPVRFPGWTVAALLGAEEAEPVLDTLVDTHLVELRCSDATGQPRYRMHDLLRCYADERATVADRVAARRVVEGYAAVTAAATERVPVRYFGVVAPPLGPDAWRPAEVETVTRDAIAWFDAEHDTAASMVELASRIGADDAAWRLAAALTPYYDLRNRREEWRRTARLALTAARRAGDVRGEAIVLRDLAQLHIYQDDDTAALTLFTHSAALFRRAGDPQGVAVSLAGLGTVHRVRGETALAAWRSRQALMLFRSIGDLYGEAVARLAVGAVHLAEGRHAEADRAFTGAHSLASALGDHHRAAHALQRLALLRQRDGRSADARELLDQAIAVFIELGDEHCAAYARQSLGEVCLHNGELDHARRLLGGSLDVHRTTGDRRSEATVAQRLGELHEALGQSDRSRTYFARAQTLWEDLSVHRRAGGADQAAAEERAPGPRSSLSFGG